MDMQAIMFPGQGAQHRGMGKALFQSYKDEVKMASMILGYDIEELCLRDPRGELIKTQFTQPALFLVNALEFLDSRKTLGHSHFLIGHSLGEYNALHAAGAFDLATGLALVQKRGELMARSNGGGMAAVMGLKSDQLHEMLSIPEFAAIDIANFNTSLQTVVSGPANDINRLIDEFTKRRIKIIPLMVSAAFHSRYMHSAAEEFKGFLASYDFKQLSIPVISNATAQPYNNQSVAELLSLQIKSSVRWRDSILFLLKNGVTNFRQVNGNVLTKMIEEIQQETVFKNKVEVDALEAQAQKTSAPLSLAERLGNEEFRKEYGVKYSYVVGAMYRGIASQNMIVKMGKARMLAFLGTGGMTLNDIEKNLTAIKSQLGPNEPYGMNLLHDLSHPEFEMQTVELYLRHQVKNVEAAAYMQLTPALVYYRVKGLRKGADGAVITDHRILAKVSRPEVAELFMKPAPDKIVRQLLESKLISEEQATLSQRVPMSYDICVEADSGGHTDGGIALVLLPSIQQLLKQVTEIYRYPKPIRIGLAGGIGTPQSAASAFIMGADFILTGSINQCTIEAGTSDAVKDLLQGINVQDTDYAPAGDMFEIGAKVQVLKKGVLFPPRANKLFNLYNQYASLDEIPEDTRRQLEKNYFTKPIAEVWTETQAYHRAKGNEQEIQKASSNPKHKMAMVFKWYFAFTGRAALEGDLSNKVNFQIHTGPALGAFNQWVKGTPLENWKNRRVDSIAVKLMDETAQYLENALNKIHRADKIN